MRIIYILIFVGFLSACSGNYEQNQKRLNELHGECDNPTKILSREKYRECKAKEMGGGESFFDLGGDLNDLISNRDKSVVYQSAVNDYLWKASLEVTKNYPLKIADNQGGFIETDWIYDSQNETQRCLIKVQILSRELITSGVSTNFICEENINEIWLSDNKEYIQEEKQITLKILETAGSLANTDI